MFLSNRVIILDYIWSPKIKQASGIVQQVAAQIESATEDEGN